MALFAAGVLALANNRRRPREPNVKQVACESGETSESYLRVREADVATLTREYMGWRAHEEGVAMRYFWF